MTRLDAAFWNKYFSVYDVLNELIPYKYLMEDLATSLQIEKGQTVLDIGSGTGNVSVSVAKKGGVPTGIDIAIAGIKVCQTKLPNCTFIAGNLMEPLPFGAEEFDKAVSNNVLYAIPPSERSLLGQEIFRVLKPGAIIVMSNIAPGFSPLNIYISHIKEEIRSAGLLHTLYRIATFIIPTIKIIYYNKLINKENSLGDYSFLSESDQEQFLRSAGFIDISPSRRVYAGNAVLTVAKKPI